MTDDIVKTLKEYKKIYDRKMELDNKLVALRESIDADTRILDKYKVKLGNYGFIVTDTEAEFIPSKDIQKIEMETGATLTKLKQLSYTFTWL